MILGSCLSKETSFSEEQGNWLRVGKPGYFFETSKMRTNCFLFPFVYSDWYNKNGRGAFQSFCFQREHFSFLFNNTLAVRERRVDKHSQRTAMENKRVLDVGALERNALPFPSCQRQQFIEIMNTAKYFIKNLSFFLDCAPFWSSIVADVSSVYIRHSLGPVLWARLGHARSVIVRRGLKSNPTIRTQGLATANLCSTWTRNGILHSVTGESWPNDSGALRPRFS